MKNLKNLGQALTKAEQKTINGGIPYGWGNECRRASHCPPTLDENMNSIINKCVNGYCVPA